VIIWPQRPVDVGEPDLIAAVDALGVDGEKHLDAVPGPLRDAGTAAETQPPSLIVEHDDAELIYDEHVYHASQRRKLLNASSEPVTRYLIRVSVDRYPGDPERYTGCSDRRKDAAATGPVRRALSGLAPPASTVLRIPLARDAPAARR
jgi:hypothetical protein